MTNSIKPVEYDDLDKLDKAVSKVRLYINEECVGEGTMQEIADNLGRSVNSLQVGLSRTRAGDPSRRRYTVELVEHVRYRRKEYILYKQIVGTHFKYEVARGDIKSIAEESGYSEIHLRIMANPKTKKCVEDRRSTGRRRDYELVLEEIKA